MTNTIETPEKEYERKFQKKPFGEEDLELSKVVQQALFCEHALTEASNNLVKIYYRTLNQFSELDGSRARMREEHLLNVAEKKLLEEVNKVRSHGVSWREIYDWKTTLKPALHSTWIGWIEIAHYKENKYDWCSFWQNSRASPQDTFHREVFDDERRAKVRRMLQGLDYMDTI